MLFLQWRNVVGAEEGSTPSVATLLVAEGGGLLGVLTSEVRVVPLGAGLVPVRASSPPVSLVGETSRVTLEATTTSVSTRVLDLMGSGGRIRSAMVDTGSIIKDVGLLAEIKVVLIGVSMVIGDVAMSEGHR